jgi:hypothetical protein
VLYSTRLRPEGVVPVVEQRRRFDRSYETRAQSETLKKATCDGIGLASEIMGHLRRVQ